MLPSRDTERASSRSPAHWADPFIKSGNVPGNIPHLNNLKPLLMGRLDTQRSAEC